MLLRNSPLFCNCFGSPAFRMLIFAFVSMLAASYPVFASSATTATMTVTSAGNAVTSVSQGTVVALTATVMSGSTQLKTGQVNFCNADAAHCTDIHLLGTAQLTSAGAAVFKFRPGPGSHSYKAVFVGTTAYASSSSNASPLSVTAPAKFPTTTAIAQSGTNGSYTLRATVGGNGSTGPTGTVSFLDTSNDNAVVATALLGAGTGFGFLNLENLTTGDVAPAVGDFNEDGIPDLVVATSAPQTGAGSLTVLLGNGDGTFTPTAANPATGFDPHSIAVGDFNRDGILDLAVANAGSNNVTVLLGNGDGTFTPIAESLPTGADPVSIVTTDFNRDGILDLAIANATGNNISVLLGKGDGTFTPTIDSPATGIGPDSIVVGDFNGDGLPDLATANVTSNNVTILLGNGDGTFTPAASPTTGAGPDAIAVADFNGDGILDLATANLGPNTSAGSVTVLLGNGDGTFMPAAASPATGINPQSIAVGDFNGDGVPDLAVANTISNTATILLGNGDGTFTSTATSPATNTYPAGLAVGDFNGDGLADIAVENDGSYNGTNVYGGYGVTVLLAAAYMATATVSGISVDDGPHLVDASFPGDDNYSASISATTNLGGATATTTLTLTVNPSGSAAPGQPVTLTATLSPDTLQGHSTNGETITFYNGSSVLGTATLSNGVAALTLTPLPNTYTVSAAYAGDTYLSGSVSTAQTLVVGPAISTTLSLTATPSGTIVSGEQVTLTAMLSPYISQGHSTNGETITFYNGTSVLGAGTLSNGTATLLVTPTESLYVSATYSEDTYFAASQSNTLYLAVSPPIATALAVTVTPNPATYGSPVTMTATLTPSTNQGIAANGVVTFNYSNTTGYSAAVQASLTNGVATTTGGVSGLQAGNYQVQATYPGNAVFEAPAPATVALTVNKAAPTVTLTSSANPAMVGTMVTFTAAVPIFPTPSEQPSELVTFYDGTTQLGVSPISTGGNVTPFSTSTLTPGTHRITAVYSGDNNNSPSTSAVLSQVITSAMATPTIALTSSANPASVSTPVTFTASLTSAAGTPTGSVTFYDGTTQLGSGPVSAGAASYSTSTLVAGAHTITATYSGDSNFSSVTSSALMQIIEAFTLGAPGGGNLPAQTALPGGQATYTLAVGPPSGTTFPAAVSFGVAGLPPGATATFSPATLPANSGPTSVTMTVTLPNQSASKRPTRGPFGGGQLPLTLGLVLLPFGGKLRRRMRRSKNIVYAVALCLASVAFVSGLTGCGGGTSAGMGSGGGTNPPPQTYTLTITATSGSLSQSITTTLTVQ